MLHTVEPARSTNSNFSLLHTLFLFLFFFSFTRSFCSHDKSLLNKRKRKKVLPLLSFEEETNLQTGEKTRSIVYISSDRVKRKRPDFCLIRSRCTPPCVPLDHRDRYVYGRRTSVAMGPHVSFPSTARRSFFFLFLLRLDSYGTLVRTLSRLRLRTRARARASWRDTVVRRNRQRIPGGFREGGGRRDRDRLERNPSRVTCQPRR